jgi:DNA excision repair protein ERCC-1
MDFNFLQEKDDGVGGSAGATQELAAKKPRKTFVIPSRKEVDARMAITKTGSSAPLFKPRMGNGDSAGVAAVPVAVQAARGEAVAQQAQQQQQQQQQHQPRQSGAGHASAGGTGASSFAEAFSFVTKTPFYEKPAGSLSAAGPAAGAATASTAASIVHPNVGLAQQAQHPPQPSSIQPTPYPHQPLRQQHSATVVRTHSAGDRQPQQGVAVGSRASLTKSHLLVSKKQRGNPLLSYVRNCPVAYDDGLVPDYSIGHNCVALFLSVKYHLIHPEYLGRRIKEVQQADRRYTGGGPGGPASAGGSGGGHQPHQRGGQMLKVVLCLCDIPDPVSALESITKVMLQFKWTLMCAWSNEEAARYLETFKKMENTSAASIQEKGGAKDKSQTGHQRAVACLTSIRSVNKTDAAALLARFGTVAKVMMATAEEMSLVPGMGPTKVKNLHRLFNERFGGAAVRSGAPARVQARVPSTESAAALGASASTSAPPPPAAEL